MDVPALTHLEQHPLFKEFTTNHNNSFLAHLLINDATTNAGYYNPSTNTITTFVITSKNIERLDNQEILHKHTIHPLDLKACTITPQQANQRFAELAKKNYPHEHTTKHFLILQQSPQGPLYNITALTLTFKTLNIKFLARNGTIISTTCEELAQRM